MDPSTIATIGAGVITLGSALASWYQSSKADDATAAERAKIGQLINQVQDPNFDMSTISPDVYKVVEKYVPQAAQVVQQQAPEVVKNTADMTTARQAQMQSLSQMQQLAAQGKDPIAEMDRLAGARQAAQEANTQNQNIQAGMQRRGIGDSAMSLGLQQQAGGQAAYQTAMSGEQAAKDALQRRMQAGQQAASIGGQVFGQDTGIQQSNVNAINQYNQEMANRAQNVNLANTNATNQAGLYNNQNAQQQSNLQAQQQINERDKQNQLKQMMYGNAMNKVSIQAGQGQSNIQGIQNTANTNQKLATGTGQTAAAIAVGYGNAQKKSQEDDYNDEAESFGKYNDNQ